MVYPKKPSLALFCPGPPSLPLRGILPAGRTGLRTRAEQPYSTALRLCPTARHKVPLAFAMSAIYAVSTNLGGRVTVKQHE